MTATRQDLQMLEIDASEVHDHPDLIGKILNHEIFGVLVRGVFPPERLARVVTRLEQAEVPAPMFTSHTFGGRTYGRVLRMADGALDEYFDSATKIGPALEAAFGESGGYQERLREIVGALSGGRPLAVPSVDDRTYAPATVRVVDPGGTVGLHCGNETYAFPALKELSEIIDLAGEISTLMPLAWPEEGGELEVYDVCADDPLIRELDERLGRDNAHQGMLDRCFLKLKPAVGDLALFEEGKYYHRVNEVRGARARWTMGGFLAPSRDAETLYYWS
jgi:hypothetical protein